MNRMQQLLVLLAVSLSVLNAHLLRSEWWQWKREHGRKYGSAVEEVKRRDVWAQNYDYIRNHNRKNQGTKLSLNQFADMVGAVQCIAVFQRILQLVSILAESQLYNNNHTDRGCMCSLCICIVQYSSTVVEDAAFCV